MVGALRLALIPLTVILCLSSCQKQNALNDAVLSIVEQQSGLEVEFKNLHDSLFTQLPDSSKSEVAEVLLANGFTLTKSSRGNFLLGPRVVVKNFKRKNCECTVALWYYNTGTLGHYELREGLRCFQSK